MVLSEENSRLKKIIAEQALSIELKEEELRRLMNIVDRRSTG